MRTEDLIDRLAIGPGAVSSRALDRQALAGLALGAVIVATAVVFGYGLRDDLAGALTAPLVAAKTLLPLLLATLALPLALRAARPGLGAGAAGRIVWIVPALTIALALLALVLTPPAARNMAFVGKSIPICVVSIPMLSLPVTALLLRALRDGAPVRPAVCGALAGLAGGATAATLYSLYCIEDSPLFWAVWYSLGIVLATVAGAVAGARVLRW